MVVLLYNKYNKPEVLLPIEAIKTDTLYVEIALPPDTVYIDKILSRIETVVKHDTIQELIFVEVLDTVYVSKIEYSFPYVFSSVFAYASTPVDSFRNNVIVHWDDYVYDKVYPTYMNEFKKKRKRGRWEGLIIGVAATALTVFLVK
jgi:hypothetical protein